MKWTMGKKQRKTLSVDENSSFMLLYSLGSQGTELTYGVTSNVVLLTSLCYGAPSNHSWHCWERQCLSSWKEGRREGRTN